VTANKSVILGGLSGLAVGASLAINYSPNSGKENGEMLKEKANKAMVRETASMVVYRYNGHARVGAY
jgi:gas vesicle protein